MATITNTKLLFSAWEQLSNDKKEISHQKYQAKIFWALAIITAVGLLLTYFFTPVGQLQTVLYLTECALLSMSLIKIVLIYQNTKRLISAQMEVVKSLQPLIAHSSNNLWERMQKCIAMSLVDFASIATHGSKTMPPPEEISAYCRKISVDSETRIALIGDLDGQSMLLERHLEMLKKEKILTQDGKVQKNCLVFVMGNFIDKDPRNDSQIQNAQILEKLLELQGKSPKSFYLLRGDSDTLPQIHNCLPLGTRNKKTYQMWIRTLPEMVFVELPQSMLTISHGAPEIGYNPSGFFYSKKASIHWVLQYDRLSFVKRVAKIDKTVSQDFAKFLKDNIDYIPAYIDSTNTQGGIPYGRRNFFDAGPTANYSCKSEFYHTADTLFIAKKALLALQKLWSKEEKVNMDTFFIGNNLEQRRSIIYDHTTPDGHSFDSKEHSFLLSQGSGGTLRILNCAVHRLKSCNVTIDTP